MPSPKILRPERILIGDSLEVPRLLIGLWQLSGGHDKEIDFNSASRSIDSLISVGLECFDMADHYGDAELVMGHHNQSSDRSSDQSSQAFTKWCPPNEGPPSFEQVEDAIDLALSRLRQTQIALLQYHAWDYTSPSYLHHLSHLRTLQEKGKIQHLGLTNFDAAHLELLINSGFNIATNQWLDAPEPKESEDLNWSLRKYLRFIRAAGGWMQFQIVLRTLNEIAKKHGVGIAAVAMRYVLDLPAIAAIIVGSRLNEKTEEYTERNLAVFGFELDDDDRAAISKAQDELLDIPGDCGDEYRRKPFLTATGDFSHHLKESEKGIEIEKATIEGKRIEYDSGSKWEPIAGYCRAVRTGNTIRVSGTTAYSSILHIPVTGGSSARSQTVAILDIIARSLNRLGGSMSDVVRTRINIKDPDDCDEVSRAHGWAFTCVGVRPANTLVVSGLIGKEFLVEIEATAELGYGEVMRV